MLKYIFLLDMNPELTEEKLGDSLKRRPLCVCITPGIRKQVGRRRVPSVLLQEHCEPCGT